MFYHTFYLGRFCNISELDHEIKIQQISSDFGEDFPYEIEIIATNLFVPWALAVSDDGRLFITERTGSIYSIVDGSFLPEPLITLEEPFASVGEGGLLGIALDPDFLQNGYMYVMYTYKENGAFYNRVVRLIEENDKAYMDTILLDNIPGGSSHNGGRLKIGPDNKLYITTGDAGDPALSQDVDSLAGKILRIDLDGGIPSDNPYPDSPVYSYGLRNPQGIAWADNRLLYGTEHGQIAQDEINIIQPGGNYGWPLVQGNRETQQADTIRPLLSSGNQTWAPSGIAYINQGPWQGKLLVATLQEKNLLAITLSGDGREVVQVDTLLTDQFGRLREVIQANDGSIYLTTSNMDGRGTPDLFDDKVIHMIPRNEN